MMLIQCTLLQVRMLTGGFAQDKYSYTETELLHNGSSFQNCNSVWVMVSYSDMTSILIVKKKEIKI